MKKLTLILAVSTLSATACGQQKHKVRQEMPAMISENFEQTISPIWKNAINDTNDSRRNTAVADIAKDPASPVAYSADVAREGKYSLKMTVPYQLGQFRSEISLQPVPMNSEYWYGFSIYMPEDWQNDDQGNILAQWHARINADRDKGDGTGQPPVALSVQGGKWTVKMHYNTNGPSFDGQGKGTQNFDGGSTTPGKWTDFVVHAKWAYTTDGFLQIWKNGKQIVDYKGPTSYMNRVAPYFKIGIYHPNWKSFKKDEFDKEKSVTRPVVVYDDAIRIAKAPATYQDVAPR